MTTLTIDDLPPYGFMRRDFEGIEDKTHPADWKLGETRWLRWLDDVTREINGCLWPAYDRPSGWRNGHGKNIALELTEVELGLLALFRDEFARSPAGLLSGRTHDEFFEWEDDSGWPRSLSQYCPELPGSTDFAWMVYLKFNKAGYVPHQLKKRFQRPRPHQTAMMLAADPGSTYDYFAAATAFTPSLVSGHCFQGLMAACTVHSLLKGYRASVARRQARRVQQWGSDIGDRRVMAGVHYPADSLASWIAALMLVEQVFDDPEMPPFLAATIRQSVLFRFLEERIEPLGKKHDARTHRVFNEAWERLRWLLDQAQRNASP